MTWIFFSLLTALIWAGVNIVDKHIISKYKLEPVVFVSILSTIGLIVGLILFFVLKIHLSFFLLLAMINGALYPTLNILYFKAIRLEEVSRVVPWFAIEPLLVVIGAAIFLNEILTGRQYLGIAILIIGLFAITLKKDFTVKPSKWMIYMFLSSLLWAIQTLFEKYLLNHADLFEMFALTEIGAFIGFLPYLLFYRRTIVNSIIKNTKALKIVAINETAVIFGTLSMLTAMSIGLVSLVSVLGSMQYLFLLVLALLFSLAYPKILKEELQGSIIVLKAISIILIIGGIYFIT
jgi:transporter family protein